MRYVYLLALILCPFSLSAQTTGNLYYLSSTTGAACYEIEYHNNLIYAGAGNTLIVYDISVNGTPDSIIYQERLPSTIVDIKFRGNIMFIAVNHAGLYTYDVSGGTPQFTDSYPPSSNDEAAYDIAFKGPDSLFVAYKSMMALFTCDANGNITFQNTFAQQVNGTYVMGCDVKNNLLAYVTSAFDTTAAGDSRTGVHLCDANNPATQYYFFQQDSCDPHDVIFGQNTNLLHVLGGTESWANANAQGIYYALNVANPTLPTLAFLDELHYNFFFNIAQPMNGEIRNDTLFIATLGSWDTAETATALLGYIYVYDCTNNNVTFVNDLYAGLWHFDLTLNGNRMYVASEWYGVKTVDITDVMNEVDLGNTLTGGWNLSSDKFGNRLVVGNEGYGFKYFDLSNALNPVYLRSKNDTGFCQGINFSGDGSHLFGWYYTDDDFRVMDTSANFNVTGSIALAPLADYYDPQAYGNLAMAEQVPALSLNHFFFAIDANNYANPVVDTSWNMGGILYRDMHVTPNGYLYVATTGNIKVYNLNNNYQLVTTITPPALQTFECLTVFNDTLYTYVGGITGTFGIRKYFFNGTTLSYISGNTPLLPGEPKFLAADVFGLYASYQEDGLYAFDKTSMNQTGHYRNSMEYYRPSYWGQQQLFCKDGYIFNVEYQGQTSILTMNSTLTSAPTGTVQAEVGTLTPFPNPVQKGTELNINNPLWSTQGVCEVYDAQGQVVLTQNLNGNSLITISTFGMKSGVYFITLTNGMFDTYTGRFVVE